MKKYHVYCLINPKTCQPFYIGKGKYVKGRTMRWRDHISEAKKWDKNSKWGNKDKLTLIKELLAEGLEPLCEIIYETDLEKNALSMERKIIQMYGRNKFNKLGILTNLTKGGEGISSKVRYNQEDIERRRMLMLGKNNPMYGKHHDNLAKNAISKTRIERIKSGDIIPTKHSEEWKQKLRENNAGGKATSKRVHQINPNDGTIIKTWKSTRNAGISLNIKTWRNISQCCNKHKNRLCCGYYWRWENDKSIIDNKLQDLHLLNLKRKGKPINQIDNDNNTIKTWNSMSEIAKHYNVVASVITQTVKNRLFFNNYYWEYA